MGMITFWWSIIAVRVVQQGPAIRAVVWLGAASGRGVPAPAAPFLWVEFCGSSLSVEQVVQPQIQGSKIKQAAWHCLLRLRQWPVQPQGLLGQPWALLRQGPGRPLLSMCRLSGLRFQGARCRSGLH